MEGQVRTFEVRRLTKEEAELASEIARALARIRLLQLQRSVLSIVVGAAAGLLANAVFVLFVDDLAAAFNVPLPLPSSGTRTVMGMGITLLLMIVGGIVGRIVGPPLFVEPRRKQVMGRLKELLRDRRLAPALQKLRRIQNAHSELYEIVREGGALPLSPDDLPAEVRGLYPRI